ncbi:hypothetical protein D3C84_926100 [compost metagenome]
MSADFVTVTGEVLHLAEYPFANAPGQPNGTHRFAWRTAVRPGHATDRHGKKRAAFILSALGHRFDHLATDRPYRGEQLHRDVQLQVLLQIGVGDITGLEPGRTAGNPGDRLGNPATGTRLGRGHMGIEKLQLPAKVSGQLSG